MEMLRVRHDALESALEVIRAKFNPGEFTPTRTGVVVTREQWSQIELGIRDLLTECDELDQDNARLHHAASSLEKLRKYYDVDDMLAEIANLDAHYE